MFNHGRHRDIEASAYPYLNRPGSSLRASSQSSIPDRIFALADNINYPYSQHLGALNAVLVLLIGKKEPEKITL
jgi:hypothetical protein